MSDWVFYAAIVVVFGVYCIYALVQQRIRHRKFLEKTARALELMTIELSKIIEEDRQTRLRSEND